MKLPAHALPTLLALVASSEIANAFAPTTTAATTTTATATATATTAMTTAHHLRPSSSRSPSRSSLIIPSAVSRKDGYDITLLPGDGIGPEIMSATRGVLDALARRCNFELRTTEALIGGSAIDAAGDPFPDDSLATCMSGDSVLLSCIGGYKWDANPRHLRPETKVLDQLVDASTLKREIVEGVDIMVVRELTGDVYFGTPKGIDVDADGKRVGYNNMIYGEGEIERIARVAGE